ncbi:hypothetical protein TAL182_CH01144 [Rhizobium sp. TAL182]|nr:hypothetical protein TAL182_CH01144 [Rhizobium sp. TAL182]
MPADILIEDLPLGAPSRLAWVPISNAGVSGKLTVGQILDLVINAAPGALDTLKELADALGDDPNYATTVTNALAAKANSADVAASFAALVIPSVTEGGLLSNNGANPNTHVDFAAMSVRSGSVFASSGSSITKRINATWAAGTGSGGLDAGAVAAGATYFAYALRKTADASLDVVLSTSPTIGGVTTTLLAGYTIVKCIGVVLTDGSSNIRPFTMYPRDEYTFTTPVKDAVNLASSTASALLALTVPNGVKAKAKLRFQFQSSSTTNAVLIHDPAQGVLVAGVTSDGGNAGAIQVASSYAIGSGEIWTNTNKQVRHVAGGAGNIWVWTDGFHFPCGRIS